MTVKEICFSHGQESGPWGTKIKAMAEAARAAGWLVESLDYRGIEDPVARADKLTDWCRSGHEGGVLAGSSMGGFVALAAAARTEASGLFLLAPALYLPGYQKHLPKPPACPTMIIHGWHDDVVPWDGSLRYGTETGAQLVLLDGDHRLTENIRTITGLLTGFLDALDTPVR